MTDRFPGCKENSEGLFAEQSTHDYDYDLTINNVTCCCMFSSG